MTKLICPVCSQPLTVNKTGAVCENNHSFDRSRQGYINLYPSNKANHGDNTEMISGRHQFLNKNYYQRLVDACITVLHPLNIHTLADVGCGEGYYTRKFKNALQIEECCGIDLSKQALKTASREDCDITYIVASINNCPLSSGSCDAVFNGFAPKFHTENARLLKEQGYLLYADVGIYHLVELKTQLYDEVLLNPEIAFDIDGFRLIKRQIINDKRYVLKEDLNALLNMTPYRYRTDPTRFSQLLELPGLDITFSFVLSLFQKD